MEGARLPIEIFELICSHLDLATLKNARAAGIDSATSLIFSNFRIYTSLDSFHNLGSVASHKRLRHHVKSITYVGALLYGSSRFNVNPDAQEYGLKAFDHWQREGAGVGLGMNAANRKLFLDQFTREELLHHYNCVRKHAQNQAAITSALSDWSGFNNALEMPDLPAIFAKLPRLCAVTFDTSSFQSGQAHSIRPTEHVLSRQHLSQMHQIVQDTLQKPLDWGCASGYLQVFSYLVSCMQMSRQHILPEISPSSTPIRSLTISGLQNSGFSTLIDRSVALEHLASTLTDLKLILPPSLLFIPYIPRYHIALFLARFPCLKTLSISGASSSPPQTYTSSGLSLSSNQPEADENDSDDDGSNMENNYDSEEASTAEWRDDCRTGHSLEEIFNAVSLPDLKQLKLSGLVIARNMLHLIAQTAPSLNYLYLANMHGPIDHRHRILPSQNGTSWPSILSEIPHHLPKLTSLDLGGCFLTGNIDVSIDFRESWLRKRGVKGRTKNWRSRLQKEILEGATKKPGGILEDGQWPWERYLPDDEEACGSEGTHS